MKIVASFFCFEAKASLTGASGKIRREEISVP
jgi:hypothetical protein